MKQKKRFFEKSLIHFVFLLTLVVFLGVLFGVFIKVKNVEKDNPVLMASDFSSASLDGRTYNFASEIPTKLTLISFDYFKGARVDGVSAFDQAFRQRYAYAVYSDESGKKYLWVRDADFYAADYQWADPSTDYKYFDQFEKSYFFKEQ